MNDAKKATELRLGVNILVILAVLTVVEFVVALAAQIWEVLIVIALIKAALVLQNYMHLPRLFSEEGGH